MFYVWAVAQQTFNAALCAFSMTNMSPCFHCLHVFAKFPATYKDTATCKTKILRCIHVHCLYLAPKWIGRTSYEHELHCHDLQVMGLNPDRVKRGVHKLCKLYLNQE